MRLTCPNCSAQYEVPDEVIPEDGRDVQCSNCEKTWFQAKHPATAEPEPQKAEPEPEMAEPEPNAAEPEAQADPEPTPEPEVDPEPEAPAEKPATAKNVDPAVASILKEEAAREADLRAQEGESLESQPDLALDAPPEPDPEEQAAKELVASETSSDAGQKDVLPDVEAINSSLLSDSASDQAEAAEPAAVKPRSGFLRGFALIVIIGIILLLVYSNAQQISDAVPQADPMLNSYVSLVDQARVWLETQTGSAAQN
ncbi:zinc-ribbon domain-containing protein [Ruegeria halocynthiae]|uniref:zinc-ribbon domain-containing protein n=1 Tax=Ruegeria halocynthiae TaxID=985054 RepID=UPI00055C11BB|nr:zinc-ribbon domain-containing protein [Ruegeria halocynthiae]